ncbi:uncharacterized protein LOC141902763 isoform X2 [Tubulanus polymorphus]|uniref:uncharacterized protein LOC141902763 isoform X2 n=1 Tax=Tubulanus polymorphus TaxID=672921 RepID=UPI003DA578CD
MYWDCIAVFHSLNPYLHRICNNEGESARRSDRVLDNSQYFFQLDTVEHQLITSNVSFLIGRYDEAVAEVTPVPFYLVSDGMVAADTTCNSNSSLVTSLIPSLDVGIMALAGFIEYPKSYCKEFVIIVQSSDDLRSFLISWRKLVSNLALPCVVEFPVVIPMSNGSLHSTARRLLADIRTTGIPMTVLHSYNIDFITEIIKLAGRELDMMNRYNKWFLTYMVKGALPKELLQNFKQDASTVNILNTIIDSNVFAEYNIAEPVPTDVLRYANILDSLIVIHRLVQGNMSTSDLSNQIALSGVNGATGDLSTYIDGCRTRIPMEVYVVQHSQPIKMVSSALIGNTTYFTTSELGYESPPKNMPLLSKKMFRIGVPNVKPMFMNDTGTTGGVISDLLDMYSKELDVRFTLVPISGPHIHEEMSRVLKSGVVDGILESDQVDTLSIEMTDPIITNEMSILMRRADVQVFGKSQPLHILIFKPFTMYSWIVLLVTCLIIGLLLVLITGVDQTTKMLYPTETIYVVIAVITLGNADKVASTIPSRVLVAFFLFFAFTIVAAYLANLTRFFVWSASDSGRGAELTSLSQLVTQGNLKFGVIRESQTMLVLEHSTSYPENLLWSTIERDRRRSILMTYDQAIREIKQGSFVLLGESIILQNLAKDDCELQTMTPIGLKIRYRIGFGTGLPYTRAFNKAISATNSNGTSAVIISKYTKNECVSLDATTSRDGHELHPEQMLPIFCIFLLAIVISFISSMFACIIVRFNRDRAWRKYKK